MCGTASDTLTLSLSSYLYHHRHPRHNNNNSSNGNDNSMALYSILFFLLLPLQIDQNVYCCYSASSLTPFFVIHKSGFGKRRKSRKREDYWRERDFMLTISVMRSFIVYRILIAGNKSLFFLKKLKIERVAQ
jgi:hypothetical protein